MQQCQAVCIVQLCTGALTLPEAVCPQWVRELCQQAVGQCAWGGHEKVKAEERWAPESVRALLHWTAGKTNRLLWSWFQVEWGFSWFGTGWCGLPPNFVFSVGKRNCFIPVSSQSNVFKPGQHQMSISLVVSSSACIHWIDLLVSFSPFIKPLNVLWTIWACRILILERLLRVPSFSEVQNKGRHIQQPVSWGPSHRTAKSSAAVWWVCADMEHG